MFLLFLACSDNTLVYEKIVESEDSAPNIMVYPPEINFGSLYAGNVKEEKIFVMNTGEIDLEIEMVETTSTAGITIETDYSFIIPPEEEREINVSYSPETRQVDLGMITIHSDDPDTPEEVVYLVGAGDAPVISVTPSEHDYGSIEVSCEDVVTLAIKNEGNKTLEVTNIMLLSSSPNDLDIDLNLIHNGNFSWYIDPGQSVSIDNFYTPNDTVHDSAIIKIESNDPMTPSKNVNLYGESFVSAYYEETFEQVYTSKADIVFVIDNSGSMNRFQSLVANNFNDFLHVFFSQGIDFRIGILTTDSFNFMINYIDNSTNNPIDYFANWISILGTNGQSTEKGLEMFYQSSRIGDLSSGFLRNDANLVAIFISDEEDHSPNSFSFYYNHMLSLKPDPNLIQAHAVIGPPPTGCSATLNNINLNADFGHGYYQLVNLFSGNVYNICSLNWGTQMHNLALSSLPMSTFQLSQEAVDGSITVNVNGSAAVGWHFDPVTNSVVFGNGFIPSLGSRDRYYLWNKNRMSRVIDQWTCENIFFADGKRLKRYRRDLFDGTFLSIVEEYYKKNSSIPFIVNSVFKKKDGSLSSKRFKNKNEAILWCDYMALKSKLVLKNPFRVL